MHQSNFDKQSSASHLKQSSDFNLRSSVTSVWEIWSLQQPLLHSLTLFLYHQLFTKQPQHLHLTAKQQRARLIVNLVWMSEIFANINMLSSMFDDCCHACMIVCTSLYTQMKKRNTVDIKVSFTSHEDENCIEDEWELLQEWLQSARSHIT